MSARLFPRALSLSPFILSDPDSRKIIMIMLLCFNRTYHFLAAGKVGTGFTLGLGRITVWIVPLLMSLPAFADSYSDKPDVQQFIGEMVTSHGFVESDLREVFRHAQYKQSIIDAITRPAEKTMIWKDYRKIFLTEKRISEGKKFIREHEKILADAEKEYGIPVSVIAAVLGVETFYGQRMGNYRVIDALSTLAFDYPPRANFFRKQLEEFLILAREERQDELSLLGSYAGAMGYGQFIPSSYRSFAVDFDKDGMRDIWQNPADAIGSVANYLKAHKWQRGQPVTQRLTRISHDQSKLFGDQLEPYVKVQELIEQGIRLAPSIGDDLVTPLLFLGGDGEEYWVGYYNFYVITRYNHSSLYAMAVYQLSRELM